MKTYIQYDERGNITASSTFLEPPGEGWIEVPEGVVAHPSGSYVNAAGEIVAYTPEIAMAKMGSPGQGYAWNNHFMRWDDVRTLQERRDAKWAEIREIRDRKEQDSTFTALGREFDSSPLRVTGSVLGASLLKGMGKPFTTRWTLADDTAVDLTADEVVEVGLAQLAHIAALHERARYLRGLIYASDGEDLKLISWDSP